MFGNCLQLVNIGNSHVTVYTSVPGGDVNRLVGALYSLDRRREIIDQAPIFNERLVNFDVAIELAPERLIMVCNIHCHKHSSRALVPMIVEGMLSGYQRLYKQHLSLQMLALSFDKEDMQAVSTLVSRYATRYATPLSQFGVVQIGGQISNQINPHNHFARFF